MITTFSTLICYNGLAENNVRITVPQPSQAVFEELANSFSMSLRCPCQQIAFRLELFTDAGAQFHPICTSPFLQTDWLMDIWNDGNWSNGALNEFNERSVLYFASLQAFCEMGLHRLNDCLSSNLILDIISSELIMEDDLVSQTKLQLGLQVNVSSIGLLVHTEMFAGMTQLNQILSIYSYNWMFLPPLNREIPYSRLSTQPMHHGSNCSCATSLDCVEPIYLDGHLVPGFVLACTPVETVLRSTLVCLYNRSCLQTINNKTGTSYQPLDSNVNSQFPVNATVKDLVRGMFMESWWVNISYSDYYKQCQPKSCSYLIFKRPDAIEVIALVLGLYSGLRVILRLTAPIMITALERLMAFLLSCKNAIK